MTERRLHVAVDGRELFGRPTGVGRWVSQLLRHWSADRDRPLQLTIFSPEAATNEIKAIAPNAEWRRVGGKNAGTLWEQFALPAAVRKVEPDVFFAPAYTAPVRLRCPAVVLIHDVSYFAHPAWFGAREGLRRRMLTRAGAHRATAVVTVSQFSADEIARWVGVPRDRIRVIYPGAPDASQWAPARPGRVRAGDPDTILYVGSLFERRHIPELIAAMPLVARRVPRARLVIVGENRAQPAIDPRALAAAHGVSDRVEWREYVDDGELERLYGTAAAFAFLSDYEGFAMTPLEAIAHGVPPVLLDTAVSREIYGDAARLVSATPTDVAQALIDLLTREGAHAALLARGLARLADFSWTAAAAAMRETLEQAAR
jgi:glycosyltransferase involved in cell wall biosynthesis